MKRLPREDGLVTVADRALGRGLPALKELPHFPVGTFPTPLERFPLDAVLPAFRGEAWVKREDASAPVGGNKVRKVEFLFGEAAARGCDAFVTTGGIGSNFCLVATWYAGEAGLEPHLVIFPHHVTPDSRRTLACIAALGPRITFCPSPTATPAVAAAVDVALRVRGRRPVLFPPGGSSTTGVLGWVDAGLELAEQVASGEMDAPDAVFIAYGSGGSAAGLALGMQLGGLRGGVVAVRVYDLPATTTAWLRSLAMRAARRLASLTGEPVGIDASRLRVEGGHLGEGYAVPTPASSEAREIARDLGMTLDPTYTSKAFAAFLDAAARPQNRDGRLLFVQTHDARRPDELLEGVTPELLPRPLRKYL